MLHRTAIAVLGGTVRGNRDSEVTCGGYDDREQKATVIGAPGPPGMSDVSTAVTCTAY